MTSMNTIFSSLLEDEAACKKAETCPLSTWTSGGPARQVGTRVRRIPTSAQSQGDSRRSASVARVSEKDQQGVVLVGW